MSNIHGISSSKSKDKNIYEQKGTTSGTATYKPPSPKASNILESLINKAKSDSNNKTSDETPNVGRIIIYRNGFIVGNEEDGDFYDIKEEKNKKMVASLLAGDVPHELEVKMRSQLTKAQQQIAVDLVNKTMEDYVPPKPKFSFNNSAGQSLVSNAGLATVATFAKAVAKPIIVDENAPTTTIQIILADKSKVKQKFNESHTVHDIYCHVMTLSNIKLFDLITGFPPKPLNDPNATIKDAGLKGASITQKN